MCTPPGDDEPTPTTEPRPATELFVYHEGETGQALRDEVETVYESVRFDLDTAVEVWGIQVYWSRVNENSHQKLMLWPDFGYNFSSYDWENPLWEKRVQVQPGDYAQPVDIWFEEPIVLEQPGLVYAGIKHEPGQPDVLMDRATNADVDRSDFPQSMVWYSDRGTDNFGFPAIASVSNNFMIGLHIARAPAVDPWFEPAWEEASGLSRVAFADYDNDGDPDLMAGARLLRNDGNGFTNVSEEAGFGGVGCNGGVWGDYDNDGYADYFCMGTADRLFHNEGDGSFVDVTGSSAINDSGTVNCGNGPELRNLPTEGAAWGDFDSDGYLDLYQANYECGSGNYTPDRLWRNEGDGSFSEVLADQGLDNNTAGRGVNWGDFDNDGDADIFVSNYRLQRNKLLRSNGDGTLSDVALATNVAGTYLQQAWGHTIGSVWDDFDADGDLDLFSANLAHPRFYHFSDRSEFLENPTIGGAGTEFISHRDDTGLVYRETSSSPALLDFDNDGDRDIVVTNVYDARPPEFYVWEDDWQVKDRHWEAGMVVWNTWGAAAADVDGDGLVDLAMQVMHRNRGLVGADNHWIKVRLEGSGAGGTNRMAIGARAYVTAGGRTQMREVSGGHGTTCQDEAVLHFGIGQATEAEVRVVFGVSGTDIAAGTHTSGTRLHVHEDGTVSDE